MFYFVIAFAFLIGVLAVLLPFVFKEGGQTANGDQVLPYRRKNSILTAPERIFFNALRSSLAQNIEICPQVTYGAVLSVNAKGSQYMTYWNKIRAKRLDFLLCDGLSMKPLVAIELDDSSHERPDRVERDIFIEKACKKAGLPVLRFKLSKNYNEGEIGRKVMAAIGQPPLS